MPRLMGRKLKLTSILILGLAYFFLGFNSCLHYGSVMGEDTLSVTLQPALQWPVGSYYVPSDSLSEQGLQEGTLQLILVTGQGTRFENGTTVLVPEGTWIAVYRLEGKPYNITYVIDGTNVTLPLVPSLGNHLLLVEQGNTTIGRWVIQVVSQEEYQALTQQVDVEPKWTWLRAVLTAIVFVVLAIPMGIMLKSKRVKVEEV